MEYERTDRRLTVQENPSSSDPEFEDTCASFIREADPNRTIVIDLTRADRLTAREAGVLIHLQKQARKEDKDLRFDLSPQLQNILRILNLDSYVRT